MIRFAAPPCFPAHLCGTLPAAGLCTTPRLASCGPLAASRLASPPVLAPFSPLSASRSSLCPSLRFSRPVPPFALRLTVRPFPSPTPFPRSLAFLSGPSFAAEVAKEMPTAVTVASKNEEVAKHVQELLSTPRFRAYRTTDVVGVELAGALKNVLAIACGICDGLKIGHNGRAALITRGLDDITRVAVASGGNPLTLSGLAGVGDIVLTCTGDLSRNRSVGASRTRARGRARAWTPERARGRERTRTRARAAPRRGGSSRGYSFAASPPPGDRRLAVVAPLPSPLFAVRSSHFLLAIAGLRLGQGEKLQDIIDSMHGMVAEGVLTSRSAHFLATKLGIDCAVLEGIYKVRDSEGPRARVAEAVGGWWGARGVAIGAAMDAARGAALGSPGLTASPRPPVFSSCAQVVNEGADPLTTVATSMSRPLKAEVDAAVAKSVAQA